ncbi:L-serine ammonia-lyase [Palleronia sediminis]|uniref:L-serine dehydratase n=1 Tax=Palleronia sediminis TaxID=2547833 RepID=A0A4R6AJH4_9RHOB|nr:L-serine ammonia-lyase [Palleronia sediminis]TDL83495.1 L-serine ammonia-lyase [Palleronia sediminis]
MFLSVLELFKIGIGPSSSHTMGPMTAARRFAAAHLDGQASDLGVEVTLWGSLAYTGKGHATDTAVLLGLAGFEPRHFDRDAADAVLARLNGDQILGCHDGVQRALDPEAAVVFARGKKLPGHTNALTFRTFSPEGETLAEETWYSIGGGFVLRDDEMAAAADAPDTGSPVPFPFSSAADLLAMATESVLSVSEMKLRNELSRHDAVFLWSELDAIVDAMRLCMDRGLRAQGTLPGGLNLDRRARGLASGGDATGLPHAAFEKVAAYAVAVNEENAVGGRVVTAPTNGAAGIVPAVMRYAVEALGIGWDDVRLRRYLLTAAAIGGIIKTNASISGADCGCQAEVGSASAMAAAGLTELLGGTPPQVENAAEIALEHHLGMTCDPVRGLVQVPCIERNGMGAIKAITAAALAMRGDGRHFISLDDCIAAMLQTGRDMHDNYKETSLGGLAVNHPNC